MIAVIIATDNRANELKECLDSLNQQSLLPDEIIIAHSGRDPETERLVKEFSLNGDFKIELRYYNFGPLGAAGQRNEGIKKAEGDILFFLDDDVICEKDFIREIIAVFNQDQENKIGAVSGTIVNQVYTPLSKINKLLFDFCLKKEEKSSSYAGKLVGPAINFHPVDQPNAEQVVGWLPSGCSGYRKSIFLSLQFNEALKDSFMEDVELSARIAKEYKLINTTKARCYHKDLGGKIHKNWIKRGKVQVLNRWDLMTAVLNKDTSGDKIRFFYYQVYCLITETRLLFRFPKDTLLRWWGRLLGIFLLLTGEGYNKAQDLAKEYYSQTALEYDRWHSNDEEHFVSLKVIAQYIKKENFKSVLDVGCGTGRGIEYLMNNLSGIKLIGVDNSEDLLAQCLNKGIPRTFLQKADAYKLPFKDGSFDAVMALGLLHHAEKPELIIQEMARVARHAIFISDANRYGQSWGFLGGLVKIILNRVGLWKPYRYLQNGCKNYSQFEKDGIYYSYSVFDSLFLIKKFFTQVIIIPTKGSIFFSFCPILFSSHVLLVAAK